MKNVNDLCIGRDKTLRQVMERIDKNKMGLVMVVDAKGVLEGTITDGDLRRFILAQGSLDQPAHTLAWQSPITAKLGAPHAELKGLMEAHKVRLIPLLDDEGRPVSVFSHRQLLFSEDQVPAAVILAGGEGLRLRPLTDKLPKPMIKVGGKPILAGIVADLVEAGFKRLFISVNYKREVIEEYFGDGSQFGAEITYIREDKKLGTAGPLALLPQTPSAPMFVINGDVVTNTDFKQLYEYHLQHRASMTVAAIEYKVRVPYGVLNLAGHFLMGVQEKPTLNFHCSAGIYVLNPELLHSIPKGQDHDMTDLLNSTLKQGLPVCTFPIHEYWIDVGQVEDLEKARLECENGMPHKNGFSK